MGAIQKQAKNQKAGQLLPRFKFSFAAKEIHTFQSTILNSFNLSFNQFLAYIFLTNSLRTLIRFPR